MRDLAVWTAGNGETRYSKSLLMRAAMKHGIDTEVLLDFAFDNLTEDMDAEQVAQSYLDWHNAEDTK